MGYRDLAKSVIGTGESEHQLLSNGEILLNPVMSAF